MEHWAPVELVRRAIARNELAVDELLRTIWTRAFRLATTVAGSATLGEDAAQEACVVVHRKLGGLRSAEAFDTWVYRVVMREAARARRRQSRLHEELPIPIPRDDTASMDIWRALESLPADLRDVTVLFYFGALKTGEIAAVLRIREATVRTRLTRARQRLRGELRDYDDASCFRNNTNEVATHAV